MTVLVAVADDGLREEVLDVAVELGGALGEELYVVHLTESASADIDARAIRDDIRADLAGADVEATVGIEHVEHDGVRTGRAVGRQLADITEDVRISHAVVGHRSKDLVRRLVEGDTAFAVADAASVPVTVVPEHVRDAGR